VEIESNDLTAPAVESFAQYIAQQTLAVDVKAVAVPAGAFVVDSDIDEVALKIAVTKA
jgi:isoleucyl-tRNA synthetase